MRGFETAVRNVTLGPDTPPVDVVLAVGRVSTTLTVTASAGKATATRLPVADDDVPAQVSSIPQELMRQQGINTVGDALRNASGVQAVRWYGAYEQYTIRGFFDPTIATASTSCWWTACGMGGNRYATQTNNIRKHRGPEGTQLHPLRPGRRRRHHQHHPKEAAGRPRLRRQLPRRPLQHAPGVRRARRGRSGTARRLLYRVDTSFEGSDGWRDAGADRLNVSPSLTWLMSDSARLTLHQTFNRDRFDGDGGVPLNIIDLPSFKPELRFSLPQDRVLVEDSQTQSLFNGNLSSAWEFRNSFLGQRTSDRYFVTEGVYGDPENNLVFREPLDFHHIRRPVQNQTEVVGRLDGFGRHNLLFGYEYHRDKYRTEVTAGDDPDCLCGYWWLTIAPMDITHAGGDAAAARYRHGRAPRRSSTTRCTPSTGRTRSTCCPS